MSPDLLLTHTDESERPSPRSQVMMRRELSSVCGEQADVVSIIELSTGRAFASVCGVEHIFENGRVAYPDEAKRSRDEFLLRDSM
jgi:nicotinamide mononucleotide (NMN) deamidase PncC